MSFSLSVAARVFSRAEKKDRTKQDEANIRLIRVAMRAIQIIHPITGSFLMDVDATHEDPDAPFLTDEPASHPATPGSTGSSNARSTKKGDTTLLDDLQRYKTLPVAFDGLLPIRQKRSSPVSYTHLTLPTKRIV